MLCFGCMQTGTYVDHKCPFTGNVAIRGRVLSGEWARPAFYFGGKALSHIGTARPGVCIAGDSRGAHADNARFRRGPDAQALCARLR